MRVGPLAAIAAIAACRSLGAEPPTGIESAWLYGDMNRYAYYYADLLIGSPNPQRAAVIVDTGSHLVGFPCTGCEHCGNHLDPAFDINRSKSARWLPCGAGCERCIRGQCSYSETYSEGSSISGLWFEDAVELGDAFSKNPPVRARLGCHTSENKLFYTQRADGIMGLAPAFSGLGASSNSPTFLQHLFGDKKHVDSAVFSICLGTAGGKLTVGGYDGTYHVENQMPVKRYCSHEMPCENDGTRWISMHTSQYYFVFPQGLLLDGRMVAEGPASFGPTIIDSGTTYTYFPEVVYRALSLQLQSYCQMHNGCGADLQEPSSTHEGSQCWKLRQPERGLSQFPTLELLFLEESHVSWPPEGYLHERGSPGVWCQTFLHNSLQQTVLGISWMLHKDVIFDLARSRLGVASATCPVHRHQPDVAEGEQTSLFSVAPQGHPFTPTEPRTPLAPAIPAAVLLLAAAARLCTSPWNWRWRKAETQRQLGDEEEERLVRSGA